MIGLSLICGVGSRPARRRFVWHQFQSPQKLFHTFLFLRRVTKTIGMKTFPEDLAASDVSKHYMIWLTDAAFVSLFVFF